MSKGKREDKNGERKRKRDRVRRGENERGEETKVGLKRNQGERRMIVSMITMEGGEGERDRERDSRR